MLRQLLSGLGGSNGGGSGTMRIPLGALMGTGGAGNGGGIGTLLRSLMGADPTADAKTIYDRPRHRQKVREGICTEEKSVQVSLKVVGDGMFGFFVTVFANDDATEPEAVWSKQVETVRPVTLLRVLAAIDALPVLQEKKLEDVYAAIRGEPMARRAIRKEIGEAAFDAIVANAPDGVVQLLQALQENDVKFEANDVTEAIRSGALGYSEELRAVGIESAEDYDARKQREDAATKKFVQHFQKWLRHMGHPGTGCEYVERLRRFALQVQQRGIGDPGVIVGTAAMLFTISKDDDSLDLSTDQLRIALEQYSPHLDKTSEFLAKRFKRSNRSSREFRSEIINIVTWWDVQSGTEQSVELDTASV